MKKEPSITKNRIIHRGARFEYLPAEGAMLLFGTGICFLVLATESEWFGYLGGAVVASSVAVAWRFRAIIRKWWKDSRHDCDDLHKL